MKKHFKNIIINISCVFVAIIVVFVSLELFFRYKEYKKRQYIENFEYLAGIPSEDNKGFREKINMYEKEKNTVRILVLGDSYSWGDKISNPKDIWPNVLQEKLTKKYPKNKIEVINLACCGFTTVNELEIFYKIGIKMLPDIVVVQFTLNDPLPSGPGLKRVGSSWLQEQYKQKEEIKELNQKKQKKKNKILSFLKRKSAFYRWLNNRFFYLKMKKENKVLYDPLYEDDFEGWHACQKSLGMISIGAKKIKAKPILMIAPYFLPGKWNKDTYPLTHLNEKIAKAGENADMYVLDLVPSFLDKHKDFSSFRAMKGTDGHPNEQAHRIMAQRLSQFIQKEGLIDGEHFKRVKQWK